MRKTNASVLGGLAILWVAGCGSDEPTTTIDAGAAAEEAAGAMAATMMTTMTTPREVDVPAPTPLSGAAPSFNDFQTILMARCATIPGCHTEQAPGEGLDLKTDTYGALMEHVSPKTGRPLIVAGSAQESYLYEKVVLEQPSAGSRMPLGPNPLSDAELETIAHWIEGGAKRE